MSEQAGGRRAHRFPARPHEHALHPSVTSTLFPNLPPERTFIFALALLFLTGLLLLTGYFRLTGPLVAAASTGVPLLYALYVYEVWLGEREPNRTFAITAVAGIVFGVVFGLLTGHYVAQTLLLNATPPGAPVGRIIVSGALLPLVAQLLMLVVPLLMRSVRQHPLDGFDLGAASALSFVLASTMVYLWPELQSGFYAVTAGTTFALQAVVRGLLVPLIAAGTTGLVVASFWTHRVPNRAPQHSSWMANPATSLAVAAVVQIGIGMTSIYVVSSTAVTLIYVGVGIGLLIWARIALADMAASSAGLETGDVQ